MANAAATSSAPSSDRLQALKEFDESKAGVKGLVDSGITSIPPFFIHPNPTVSSPPSTKPRLSIPTVDLSLPRSTVVDIVRSAAASFGFFQVVNHGIPSEVVDGAISAVRSFNELPLETRSKHYSRQFDGGVSYASNFDLFRSPAASWRDTIQIQLGPSRPDASKIPETCRREVLSYEDQVRELGREMMGVLSEGLGLEKGRLEELSCCEGMMMVCHYYPWCPEPEKTTGLTKHTDPGVLTVLAQDMVGGLQVKWTGIGEEAGWVDVEPVDGALVVNVGDLLQIISNDEYKSVEHRAVANSHKDARVSIAVFFNPGKRGDSDYYGPLPELVSDAKPPIYRNFTMREFLGTFLNKALASKGLLDSFKSQ